MSYIYSFNTHHADNDALTKIFIEKYYSDMNTNQQNVHKYYDTNAKITFNGKNLVGSTALFNEIVSKNIIYFGYDIKSINCQHDRNRLLINVSGNITTTTTDNNSYKNSFVDTFILENKHGYYYITNQIFIIVT